MMFSCLNGCVANVIYSIIRIKNSKGFLQNFTTPSKKILFQYRMNNSENVAIKIHNTKANATGLNPMVLKSFNEMLIPINSSDTSNNRLDSNTNPSAQLSGRR